MKPTYLTLFGSVSNKVGNRHLVGTIGKITGGSQLGIAFLICTIPRYLSKVISSWYAAHWLSIAVLTVYHFLSYQEGIVSVRGILQVRILEWVDIPFSRGSSQPRD